MKLYDAPVRTWVKVITDNGTPPVAPHIEIDEIIWFGHIDGMYSYCKNKKGEVVHLVGWANVEVVEEMIGEPAPERL